MQMLEFCADQNSVARNQMQHWYSSIFFTKLKKSTDILMKENQHLVWFFKKADIFPKKQKQLRHSGYTCPKPIRCKENCHDEYHWTMFCRYKTVDWDSERRNQERCFGKNRLCLPKWMIQICHSGQIPRTEFLFHRSIRKLGQPSGISYLQKVDCDIDEKVATSLEEI